MVSNTLETDATASAAALCQPAAKLSRPFNPAHFTMRSWQTNAD